MKKILILTDFSSASEHASEIALKIASRSGAAVIFYHAFYQPELVPIATMPYSYIDENEQSRGLEEKKLKEFCQKMRHRAFDKTSMGIPPISMLSDAGKVGPSLEKILPGLRNVWFIVMGCKNHASGAFDRFIAGSDAESIVKHSTKPILLIPHSGHFASVRSIAMATSFEKNDYRALRMLVNFAQVFNAKITVVHVCKDQLSVEEKLKNVSAFHKVKARLAYNNIYYEDVKGTEIAETLMKFSSAEKINLLAVIHKEHSLLDKMLHGSVTHELMDGHKIPLMIFPVHYR